MVDLFKINKWLFHSTAFFFQPSHYSSSSSNSRRQSSHLHRQNSLASHRSTATTRSVTGLSLSNFVLPHWSPFSPFPRKSYCYPTMLHPSPASASPPTCGGRSLFTASVSMDLESISAPPSLPPPISPKLFF